MPPKDSVGKASPTTQALRPQTSLSEHERKLAKDMRREGKSFQDISYHLGKNIDDVEKALATIRTRQERPSRYTLNVHPEAYAEIERMRQGDEPVWKTINRILGIE